MVPLPMTPSMLPWPRRPFEVCGVNLPQYFMQRARKLAQNSDLLRPLDKPPPPPLPPSQSATISSRLHHSPLSCLASSTDHSHPLSLPPPRLTRRAVPHPSLSCLRRWLEGTAASPHPSPSRRRRGKIPSISVVLRSDDDASRRPPPPSSCAVQHLLS
jgi:hypothetical protein